jgi:hypothetical protein
MSVAGQSGTRVGGLVLLSLLLPACGMGGEQPGRPDRARYQADKAHCDSISDVEPARNSCMIYRGWPNGKLTR